MTSRTDYDVLIVGGGIAGLQAAIDIGDQGYRVLVVEKEPSIGGKMIALSKVFPTLDCASCICTPRMAEAAHHDNVTIMTYAEVASIERNDGLFSARVVQKPRFVSEKNCIGCRKCEYVCPVDVPHEFEGNLGARKAIYIPFTNAIPQVALLDIDNCIRCGRCEAVCPADAIEYDQQPEEKTLSFGAVVLTTGYELSPMNTKPEYRGDELVNVLDPLQMERLLAPHGPYGRVLRPSDGKMPESVAYVLCAGSRDKSIGVPYCSRICCMAAIKQAILLSGALPFVDITIFYMDIRAFGKGYEQFYQNAKSMGIEFVKGKVAKINEDEEHNPIVRVEVQEGESRVEERKFDMVVLMQASLPGWCPSGVCAVETSEDGFLTRKAPHSSPALTTMEGVFTAGAAAGPKDIPDTIAEAGSAAMETVLYLRSLGIEPGTESAAQEVSR